MRQQPLTKQDAFLIVMVVSWLAPLAYLQPPAPQGLAWTLWCALVVSLGHHRAKR